MEKICSKCKIKKTLNDFSIDKNTKSGVRSQCKECISKRYILNKERVLLKQKEMLVIFQIGSTQSRIDRQR